MFLRRREKLDDRTKKTADMFVYLDSGRSVGNALEVTLRHAECVCDIAGLEVFAGSRRGAGTQRESISEARRLPP